MVMHTYDGRGDAGYGAIGSVAAPVRRPDGRIARVIAQALGDARIVLNVGAGTGSYETAAHTITAVEPSPAKRARRPARLATAIDAVAEDLPFAQGHFDAAMALFSVHEWDDVEAGLREMRRVTRGPVAVLTCDPARVRDFWLYEYAPDVLEIEAGRYPSLDRLTTALGGATTIQSVPVPLDCTDGFNEAYYGRPEMLLNPAARQGCSAWSFIDDRARQDFDISLRRALGSGAWDEAFGHLRSRPVYDGSLVLLRATP
ncbi:class I SAM-dependent methyltransferase [Streptomyces sp. NBC_01104]|uniref:class I SAM-dependent methyltransferase n=2 Tax=unclassified Streptomyces TaxID=2593676 RepID=UPI00386BCB72|nr:class I SAM-dependent methyltransferase [Streptomyces sp. NBC_01104]